MKNKIGLSFLLLLLTTACGDTLHHKHIKGNYYYVTENSRSEVCIGYRVNDYDESFVLFITEDVVEEASDDNFIIAKQKLNNSDDVVNYYIVSMQEEFTYSPEKFVVGPITLDEFELKRKELGVPENLKFKKLDVD